MIVGCKYKYSTDEVCGEYTSVDFCDRHKDTYQSRNYKRILTVGNITVMLYNNEAIFSLNGSKSMPLNEKEVILLESKGIKVNKEIRDLIFKKEEENIPLNDTFINF